MKRIAAIALTALMLAGLLAACTGNPDTPDTSGTPGATGTPASTPQPTVSSSAAPDSPPPIDFTEPIKLTILNNIYATIPPDVDINNNKWTDIFKEELPDYELNWILVANEVLTERKNLMMGSGDYPDILEMNQSEMVRWSGQGLLCDLTDLHDLYYPNVYNFLTSDDLKTSWYDGRIYGVKTIGSSFQNPPFLYIRTDWLENLGMSMPTTVDELYDVLYAFRHGDPTGTGASVYGVVGAGGTVPFGQMWSIWNSFSVEETYWKKVGNEIIPDIIRPEMKEALQYFNKLWAADIIDKDTIIIGGSEVEARGTQGLAGVFGMWSYGMAVRAYPNMLAGNPDAAIAELLPMAYNGKIEYAPAYRAGGRTYGVTIACSQPEAVLALFNWTIEQDLSREPYYALNADKIYLGELGVNSAAFGRFIGEMNQSDLSPEATLDLYRLSYRFHMGTMQSLPMDLILENNRDTLRIAQEEGRILHETLVNAKDFAMRYGRLSDLVVSGTAHAEYWDDLWTYWQEVKTGIVTGDLPLSDFDAWVDFFYANGGRQIVEEVTALNK